MCLEFGSWLKMPRPPLYLLQLTSFQPDLSFDPDESPRLYNGMLAYLPGLRCDRVPRGSMHNSIAHDPYISVGLIEVFHNRDFRIQQHAFACLSTPQTMLYTNSTGSHPIVFHTPDCKRTAMSSDRNPPDTTSSRVNESMKVASTSPNSLR